MQQQQAEVAPDQKEDKKCPNTPSLILDDATPQNSDASGPSYSSTSWAENFRPDQVPLCGFCMTSCWKVLE